MWALGVLGLHDGYVVLFGVLLQSASKAEWENYIKAKYQVDKTYLEDQYALSIQVMFRTRLVALRLVEFQVLDLPSLIHIMELKVRMVTVVEFFIITY